MTGQLRESLAELSGEVRFTDLHDRVLAGSRRITLRNRALGTGVAIAAIAVIALGAQALRPVAQPIEPAESPTPEPVVTSAPATPPSSAPSGNPMAIYNATIDVPAFPNTDCKAGKYQFVNGEAKVKDYTTLKLGRQQWPVSNVDGVPGGETLVGISCRWDGDGRSQLLALTVAPEKITTLGFVFATPMGFDVAEGVKVSGGAIHLEVYEDCTEMCPSSEKQLRGYAYQNGRFQQVSGPTRFSYIPATAQVDPRNTTLGFLETPASAHGNVVVANGTGQAMFVKEPYSEPVNAVLVKVTVGAFVRGKRSGDDVIAAIVTITEGSAAPRQVVYVFKKQSPQHKGPVQGKMLTISGVDGVTEIKTITAGTDVVRVIVSTSSGEKTLTYRPDPNSDGGMGWTKS